MQRIPKQSKRALQCISTTRRIQTQKKTPNMPLVVPGVTADNMGGDKTQEWTSKLAGKTLCEGPSSETVISRVSCSSFQTPADELAFLQAFCKTELPQQSRVVEPGSMMTRDFNPDRLNVFVKDDGTVSHVTHG